MIKKYLLSIVFSILLMLVFASVAAAQTDVTMNLGVSANVVASCRMSSVSNVGFGTYDPTDSNNDDDGAGSMTFRCVKATAYKTFITGTREMSGTTDTLTFELYTDAGRTTVFPSDNSGSSTNATSNAPVTANIYGRIPALQDVGVDSYSATLVATVEY